LIDSDGARRALSTERSPEKWLASVGREGHALIEDEALTADEQGDELLLMGLRLADGIDLERFTALRGRPLAEGALSRLDETGMIERTGSRIRVTRAGFPLLDAVVADLAA
jgi:oxygen-independent coproporphyrinogen-3 oxidase